ncbi:hypothetical protein [Robiginitalea sp. IMCC43444]|uniref:hypothetical protein n=1 Tax=Robiginitalea sp. IMCC43444 TaxID=3459121 RepID=UPI0040417465
MKKQKTIFLLSFLLMLTPVLRGNPTNPDADYFLLTDGQIVSGEIVKFGSNAFKVKTNKGLIRIKNADVTLVAIGQELTSGEKMKLGILDGKRYAKNKGGNLAVGFFFGLIGTAVVYASSDQMPSYKATEGPNKALVDDTDYLLGYARGAKKKSGGNALIGSAISFGLFAIIASTSL